MQPHCVFKKSGAIELMSDLLVTLAKCCCRCCQLPKQEILNPSSNSVIMFPIVTRGQAITFFSIHVTRGAPHLWLPYHESTVTSLRECVFGWLVCLFSILSCFLSVPFCCCAVVYSLFAGGGGSRVLIWGPAVSWWQLNGISTSLLVQFQREATLNGDIRS